MEDKEANLAQSASERAIITLRLEAEDAKRLNEAFLAGKLSEFGIVDIQPVDGEKHPTHRHRSRDSGHKPRQR